MTNEQRIELENALLALQEQAVYIYDLVMAHPNQEELHDV